MTRGTVDHHHTSRKCMQSQRKSTLSGCITPDTQGLPDTRTTRHPDYRTPRDYRTPGLPDTRTSGHPGTTGHPDYRAPRDYRTHRDYRTPGLPDTQGLGTTGHPGTTETDKSETSNQLCLAALLTAINSKCMQPRKQPKYDNPKYPKTLKPRSTTTHNPHHCSITF